MATNAAKHLLVRESVDEIKISEQEQHIQAEVICRMPVTKPFKPTKIPKTFDCEYPTVDPNVSRVSQPLPFPDTLADTIAWTDAFVDRIASMTAAQEKKTIKDMTLLAREIERLRTALATTEVALDQSRTETQKAQDETKDVRTQLVASEAKSQVQAQTIKDMQARADKEAAEEKLLRQQIRTLTSENTDLLAKLGKADKALADEHVRLTKEQKKHHQDHADLKKEHELLAVAKRELVSVQADLTKVKIDLANRDKTIRDLKAKVSSLEADLLDTDNRNTGLRADLTTANEKLDASEHKLDEANKAAEALTVEVAAAKERISVLDKKVKTTEDTVCSLEKKITGITDEKNVTSAELTKVQTDLTKANAEVTTVKADLQTAKADIVGLTTDVATAKDLANKMEKAMLAAEKVTAEAKNSLKEARREKEKAEKALEDAEENFQQRLVGAHAAADVPLDRFTELTKAEKTVEELKSKISALEKRLIPAAPVNSSRVNILSVEYGGTAYKYDAENTKSTGSQVLTKLYQHASNGTSFHVDNKFFIKDPWQGHKKTCSITYQLDGEGAPLQIVCKEHDDLSFVLKK